MTDTPPPHESLFKFPCDFMIKIFGTDSPEFESAVYSILQKHVPHFSDRAIDSRRSKEGHYLALSITFHVTSKEQLDNIYRALSSSPQVIMVL